MKHLGDITKIKGNEIKPVFVVTYGAPCQDLSVAGKRAGLKSELMGDEETTRSGLFYDALRVIEEMRSVEYYPNRGEERRSVEYYPNGTAESVRYPRYTVYENVPGALTSNKGEDWASVLKETIKVIWKEVPDIPVPENGWPTAGCIVAEDGKWSLAWRVHDAQYWGVPQRRRRVALVTDYWGVSAPKVLFECDTRKERRQEVSAECESLSGNSDESG